MIATNKKSSGFKLSSGVSLLPSLRSAICHHTTARAYFEPGQGQWPEKEAPAKAESCTRNGIASGRGTGVPVTGVGSKAHHPTGGMIEGTTGRAAPETTGMATVAATSERASAAEAQLAPGIIPQHSFPFSLQKCRLSWSAHHQILATSPFCHPTVAS